MQVPDATAQPILPQVQTPDPVANRKLAYLLAIDLFGLKSEAKSIPFKEKYREYTVVEIVTTYLLKIRKKQGNDEGEAHLYASAVMELWQKNTPEKQDQVTQALVKFLKIDQPTTTISTKTKFNKLITCFKIEDGDPNSDPSSYPFTSGIKSLKVLPKMLYCSQLLVSPLISTLKNFKELSAQQKLSIQRWMEANNATKKLEGKSGKKNTIHKEFQTAKKEYQEKTDNEMLLSQATKAIEVCQQRDRAYLGELAALENITDLEPRVAGKILFQIAQNIKKYVDSLPTHIHYLITNGAQVDLEKDTALKQQIGRSKGAIVYAGLFENLGEQTRARNKLSAYSYIHSFLLHHLYLVASQAAEQLTKTTPEQEQDLMSSIDMLDETKRKKKEKKPHIAEEEQQEALSEEDESERCPPKPQALQIAVTPNELFELAITQTLNACQSPSQMPEVTALLCQKIKHAPRFQKDELGHLADYESRAYRSAIAEASDHLFLSGCGFEAFATALKEQRLDTLSVIFRMLVLDWHGVSEQARRAHFIILHNKTTDTHFLLKSGIAPQPHLQGLDNGLIWSRYPASQMTLLAGKWPEALSWMRFCQKLQKKAMKRDSSCITDADLEQLKALLEYICTTQTAIWKDASQLLCRNGEIQPITDAMDRVKTTIGPWILALKGKSFAELVSSPSGMHQEEILRLLQEVTRRKKPFKNEKCLTKTVYDRPKELLGDIKVHLRELHAALALREKNQSVRLEALLHRNLLNLQWPLESSYRLLGVINGIRGVKNHDFTIFHTYLKTVNCEISAEEQKMVTPWNMRESTYYPNYVKYTRGHLPTLAHHFLKKLQRAKDACLHGEDHPLASLDSSLDEPLLNGLSVLGRHMAIELKDR